MRQSHTAIIERNVEWRGDYALEPYEVGWATEAVYFIRSLEVERVPAGTVAQIQISPDGMHWCDEGSVLPIPSEVGLTFCRLRHFGGWLRAVGTLPDGARLKVIVYLVLKE